MSKYVSRYHKLYNETIVANLIKELGLSNVMECPKLDRIVVNMGVGEATQNSKLIDAAMADLAIITGQKPVVRKAKKSECSSSKSKRLRRSSSGFIRRKRKLLFRIKRSISFP